MAETTVDALGHVNIISRRPSRPVLSFFSLDSDGLGGADGLAELAGDATFFARRVAAQGVFASEPWRYGSFFERVVDGVPVGLRVWSISGEAVRIVRLYGIQLSFRIFCIPKIKDESLGHSRRAEKLLQHDVHAAE